MNRALTYLILVALIGGMLTGLYRCGVTAGERAKDLAYAPKMEELRLCTANTKYLQTQLVDQNQKIEALAAESKAAQQRAEALVVEARRVAQQHTAKAQTILMAEPKTDDRCQAAADLLLEHLQ